MEENNLVVCKDSVSLIWRKAEVKDIFQNYKQWPSFIGNAVDLNKETKTGLMPVFLWPEQKSYIECSKLNCLVNSKKRNRDDLEDLFPENEVKVTHKRHRSIWNYFNNSLSQLASFIKKQVISVIFPISQVPQIREKTIENNEPIYNNFQEAVYYDLKRRNYFLGPGDIYGGDYTIYKGSSPADSHSTATVRVNDAVVPVIRVSDLLAFTRVQTQVAKSAVIAFPNDDSKNNDAKLKYLRFYFKDVSVRG